MVKNIVLALTLMMSLPVYSNSAHLDFKLECQLHALKFCIYGLGSAYVGYIIRNSLPQDRQVQHPVTGQGDLNPQSNPLITKIINFKTALGKNHSLIFGSVIFTIFTCITAYSGYRLVSDALKERKQKAEAQALNNGAK